MIRLHSYWRSSAAYRVRIALNLKGVEYEQVTHDLRAGAQRDPSYLALAPQGLVPALETDDGILVQSSAILEWLEERWPTPPLLPQDRAARAVVRAMAAVIGCDIHPINNLRVLKTLKKDFGASPEQLDIWAERWIAHGFDALETMVARHGGRFCHGDVPRMVDCYLVPQSFNAERIGIDLARWPLLAAKVETARQHPAFAAAHPLVQPDAGSV